jgi:hypothetical protein
VTALYYLNPCLFHYFLCYIHFFRKKRGRKTSARCTTKPICYEQFLRKFKLCVLAFIFYFALRSLVFKYFFAVNDINQYEFIFLLSHYRDKKQQSTYFYGRIPLSVLFSNYFVHRATPLELTPLAEFSALYTNHYTIKLFKQSVLATIE